MGCKYRIGHYQWTVEDSAGRRGRQGRVQDIVHDSHGDLAGQLSGVLLGSLRPSYLLYVCDVQLRSPWWPVCDLPSGSDERFRA